MNKTLVSEHGIVCRLPGARLGYFGWPAVARLDDGALAVASSGLRSEHICPWGKTVLNVSRDDGPDSDLGYPTSVELGDGSIFTVYYQKAPGDAKCSLLWSRWTLP